MREPGFYWGKFIPQGFAPDGDTDKWYENLPWEVVRFSGHLWYRTGSKIPEEPHIIGPRVPSVSEAEHFQAVRGELHTFFDQGLPRAAHQASPEERSKIDDWLANNDPRATPEAPPLSREDLIQKEVVRLARGAIVEAMRKAGKGLWSDLSETKKDLILQKTLRNNDHLYDAAAEIVDSKGSEIDIEL